MTTQFQQGTDIEFAPLQDEVILYHAPSNKYCVLNCTSAFIWAQLEQPRTTEEIADRLVGAFREVTVEQAKSDVDTALQEMLALGLIAGTDSGGR